MEHNKLKRFLFVFFGENAFVLTIVGIIVFLKIGAISSLVILGWALSLRTLSSALFSYVADHLVNKIGIKKAFLLSQVVAMIAVLSLAFGFYHNELAIILLSTILLGVPFVLIQFIALQGQTHNYLVYDELSKDGVFVPELIGRIVRGKPVEAMVGMDGFGLTVKKFNMYKESLQKV